MTFDEWIYAVCIYLQTRKATKVELQDIYSAIDLKDIRYAFMDGIAPEDYRAVL